MVCRLEGYLIYDLTPRSETHRLYGAPRQLGGNWGTPGKSQRLGLPTHLAIERPRPHIVHHIKKGSENASAARGLDMESMFHQPFQGVTIQPTPCVRDIDGILTLYWWDVWWDLHWIFTGYDGFSCTLNKSKSGPITPANSEQRAPWMVKK